MPESIEEVVVKCIAKVCEESRIACAVIEPAASLVDTIGLDSLRFVDLTVALEDGLGISEFPMQQWVDQEMLRPEPRFTVAHLVERCREIMSTADGAPPASGIAYAR